MNCSCLEVGTDPDVVPVLVTVGNLHKQIMSHFQQYSKVVHLFVNSLELLG